MITVVSTISFPQYYLMKDQLSNKSATQTAETVFLAC